MTSNVPDMPEFIFTVKPSSEELESLVQLAENSTLLGNHILEEAKSVAKVNDSSDLPPASKL